MKIIDENGAAIENPDLTLGYLVDDTEPVEHPAVEGVEEVSHYETVTEYPGGGRDVRKVIDVPGVPAQAAWTEQVPVQRYIRYTEEELAAREKERQQAEEAARLPETSWQTGIGKGVGRCHQSDCPFGKSVDGNRRCERVVVGSPGYG